MSLVAPSHLVRWSQLPRMVAAISLLMVGGAWAQSASDFHPGVKVKAANAEWRKLSQNEINCVDRSLRARRSGVWFLIQRGIEPSDPAVAAVRAACHSQAGLPQPATPSRTSQAVAPKPATAALTALAAAPKRDDAAGQAEATKAAPALGDKVTFKAMGETAAAEKTTVDKTAVSTTSPDKTDKAAADKLAAEDAAAQKAATDQAAADKAAEDKAAEKAMAAAEKASAGQAATEPAPAESTAIDLARAEVDRAKAEAVKAQADAERARKEADKAIADAGFALASAESKISFIYGLITGLVLLGVGVLLFTQRQRFAGITRPALVTPEAVSRDTQVEVDRLVVAVLNEQKRREKNASKLNTPAREPRIEEPAVF
jgi:hypothetical protein